MARNKAMHISVYLHTSSKRTEYDPVPTSMHFSIAVEISCDTKLGFHHQTFIATSANVLGSIVLVTLAPKESEHVNSNWRPLLPM